MKSVRVYLLFVMRFNAVSDFGQLAIQHHAQRPGSPDFNRRVHSGPKERTLGTDEDESTNPVSHGKSTPESRSVVTSVL